MRLWHQKIIPALPVRQLQGQHRECCALRGLGWGKPHSTVNYVFGHPPGWLVAYHRIVLLEKQRRGHRGWDISWFYALYRGVNSPPWTKEELGELPRTNRLYYPEHDDDYLQECLDNLAAKGIVLDESKFIPY